MTAGGDRATVGHMAKTRAALVGEGMISRRLVVDVADAVLVKAVIEAHEGVACVFGEERGVLIVAAPVSREGELDLLMLDVDGLLRARHG